jgi:hypothetical protein
MSAFFKSCDVHQALTSPAVGHKDFDQKLPSPSRSSILSDRRSFPSSRKFLWDRAPTGPLQYVQPRVRKTLLCNHLELLTPQLQACFDCKCLLDFLWSSLVMSSTSTWEDIFQTTSLAPLLQDFLPKVSIHPHTTAYLAHALKKPITNETAIEVMATIGHNQSVGTMMVISPPDASVGKGTWMGGIRGLPSERYLLPLC